MSYTAHLQRSKGESQSSSLPGHRVPGISAQTFLPEPSLKVGEVTESASNYL